MGKFRRALVLYVVATAWICLSTAGARVVMVREDDGGMDEPRGHVSSPSAVLKKVLPVVYEPGQVQRAWVMYRMKINPYHVATQCQYGAPVDGLAWNRLVIRVNGQEVLREPLVPHAAAGWHEVPISPDTLQRGDNDITFGLDEPGGYFYMAVDDDGPLDHSAVSSDGGETFQFGNVSPGAEVPEPGEFMVRLKLDVPVEEMDQIEMRDDHGYGWLEVEDLFSRNRKHAGGWLAIPWTRGTNAPSRELTTHTQQDSSFSYGFDLPRDGPWYVASIDPTHNNVYVARRHEVEKTRFHIEKSNWFIETPFDHIRCSVKIRYQSREVPCTVSWVDRERVAVEMKTPQVVAPGQSAVFYLNDLLLGGGVITP